MPNEICSGNDGLIKDCFETFWPELKKAFLSCILHSFGKEKLLTSQRQAITKLIAKKTKIKINPKLEVNLSTKYLL